MPSIKRIRGGRVAGLFVGGTKGQVKHSVDRVSLTFDGIKGDAHSGRMGRTGPREPGFARDTAIVNVRQLSLVSIEELGTLAERLGLRHIDPAWLAANIATEGLGPITQLPPGTLLRGSSGASVYLTELNSPCRLAARLLYEHSACKLNPASFVKHALGRRGLVALVYSEGDLAIGDELELLLVQPERPAREVEP